jgi:putative hemolysin
MIIAIQILVLVLLIGLSAFFAGSETGVYRLSRFHLRIDVEQGRPFAGVLSKIVSDSHALIFSILIGNNLTNYLATSITMVILLSMAKGVHAEFLATVIMTPVLFVFAEVLPKNIFYNHSNSLMRCFAPLLWFFHRLFTYTGIVVLLKLFSRLFATPSGNIGSIGKGRIAQIIRETGEEGMLSHVQIDLMNRLVKIPSIATGSVMTPMSSVEMLDINSTRGEVVDKLRGCPYTRLPVYENNRANIKGYINIYKALGGDEGFADIRKFVEPIKRLSPSMKIMEAMNILKKDNCKVVLIDKSSRHKHMPLGLITMKDIAEELTGELEQW